MPMFDELSGAVFGVTDDRSPLVLLHGLTYDRRQWTSTLRELALIDPDRRVLAIDLPGHGESCRGGSYRTDHVAEIVHRAVTAAGMNAPTMVGHSLGAVIATVYAGRYPARSVVNIDQPLLLGPFGAAVRKAEPVLRSPAWHDVWDAMLAGMHVELLPPEAQVLVRTATDPRPDLLLGYWGEILESSDETITAERTRDLAVIRSRDVSYHYVASNEPTPAYRNWLATALPEVAVTVLPGGSHFPHLAHPVALAKILAARDA
jgi:pimeloyl-ACP methyl ester carboxylesterase